MEFINYISTLLLSYLGLGAGIALAIITKEEILSGKRYFIILQNMLIIITVLTTIYFLETPWLIWIILIGYAFLIPLIKKQRKKSFLIYLLLAIIFWASSQPNALFPIKLFFPIVGSLIFLIGFPTGSLLLDLKKKNILQIIISNFHYIVIGLILYFV